MSACIWTWRGMAPAIVAAGALITGGCTESTTRDDVADAQEELREEQAETAEVRREGQQEVAEAQRDAEPYTVNKPVDGTAASEDTAEAQQEARQDLRDQQQDQQEAATELRTTEQQFAATQQRDAFVREAEQKLAEAETRIDEMKSTASTAEGTNKEAMDRTINDLESQHDRAEEALDNLKSADLAQWQTHRDQVRTAMQQLTTNMNNIR